MFIDIHVHVVSDCEMPVLFHVATRDHDTYGLIDDFGLPRFEEAVRKFPGITWLCHSQAWWSFIGGDVGEDEWDGYPKGRVVKGGRVVELMRRYPNVYGDLSAGSGFNAVSRDPAFGHWFMDEFQDQLCFGTDIWRTSHRDGLLVQLANFMKDALTAGKISQEVFDKIACGNAERVLGL